MALVKICGITNESDLNMVLSCEPNAVGFIVDVPVDTPRKIDAKKAKKLVKKVPILITSVLVMMPEKPEEAINKVNEIQPDVLQIHSDLSVEVLKEIKEAVPTPIIKTIGVDKNSKAKAVINRILSIKDTVDAILLDTKTDQKVGGSGITHNWNISAKIVENTSIPIILAGGLTPENVASAVSIVNPFAVDTASGVESCQGKKDVKKLDSFLQNVKRV